MYVYIYTHIHIHIQVYMCIHIYIYVTRSFYIMSCLTNVGVLTVIPKARARMLFHKRDSLHRYNHQQPSHANVSLDMQQKA